MEITKEIREKIVEDMEKFQEEINSYLHYAKSEILSPSGNLSEAEKSCNIFSSSKKSDDIYTRFIHAKNVIDRIRELLKAWEKIARI